MPTWKGLKGKNYYGRNWQLAFQRWRNYEKDKRRDSKKNADISLSCQKKSLTAVYKENPDCRQNSKNYLEKIKLYSLAYRSEHIKSNKNKNYFIGIAYKIPVISKLLKNICRSGKITNTKKRHIWK